MNKIRKGFMKWKNKYNGLIIALMLVGFTIILYWSLLVAIIPWGIQLLNKKVYYDNVLQQEFIMENISLLISIFTIPLTILGAFITSNRYLSDIKVRAITESRIDWMYKMRGNIIKLNNEVNKYLDCDHQDYKRLKGIKRKIYNYVEEIILYLAPENGNNSMNDRDLDRELESKLIKLKKAINDDFTNFHNDSERDLIIKEKERLLAISRIYFKIEWEKVKYEAINDAQDLYNTNEEYKGNYKEAYERD